MKRSISFGNNDYVLTKSLRDDLVGFVNDHIDVLAAFSGNDPEDGNSPQIYFLTGSGGFFDVNLQDAVTDLERDLLNQYVFVDIPFFSLLPLAPDRVKYHGFIKDPIYIK